MGGRLDPRVEDPGRPAWAAAENKGGIREGRSADEIVLAHEVLDAQQLRMRSDAAQPLKRGARDAQLFANRVDVEQYIVRAEIENSHIV